MARIVYNISTFDPSKAMEGTLCVMVSSSVSGSTIANIDTSGSANTSFKGAGICKFDGLDTYSMTIQGTKYKFNKSGVGIYDASSYKVMLASIDSNAASSGNAIKSSSTTVVTRSSSGATTTTVNYGSGSDIIIDSLNARDEFAVQALKQLLDKVPNPTAVSDSEMSFYCDTAYQWAAHMMEASANARGSFNQQSGSTETTTTRADVAESSLSTNTEKLLNNIVSALENTKKTLDNMLTFYNTYYKNGVNITNLSTLVTAVNSLTTAVSGRVSSVNSAISSNTSSISSLSSSVSSLDTRVKALEDASSSSGGDTTTGGTEGTESTNN